MKLELIKIWKLSSKVTDNKYKNNSFNYKTQTIKYEYCVDIDNKFFFNCNAWEKKVVQTTCQIFVFANDNLRAYVEDAC